MTIKARNLAFVLAFASIMVAMPFSTANSKAFAEETTALIVGSCGYNVPASLAFASITPGTTTTLSASFTDWSVVADKNGSSRILVEGSDWVGLGDRAEGSITVVGIAEDETVEVRGVTYTAKDAPSLATEFLSGATNDLDSAESLATKIRANDSLVRTSTSGTNVVTIQAETRGNGLGSPQNGYSLAEAVTDAGTLVSGANLSGGGSNVQTHLVAENTKYAITTDNTAPTTTYGSMTAFKTAAAAAVAPKEMIGGTDVSNPIKLNLGIDVTSALTNLPYEGTITQTLTFTITCDGT